MRLRFLNNPMDFVLSFSYFDVMAFFLVESSALIFTYRPHRSFPLISRSERNSL